MMTRGIRGATTIEENREEHILATTKTLVEEMIMQNNVKAEAVSHVFISVTKDIDACFPAKSLRDIPGWTHVPVMCMQEIDVPNSLEMCIRVMMVVKMTVTQQEVSHIFHNQAIKLRPDLIKKTGE